MEDLRDDGETVLCDLKGGVGQPRNDVSVPQGVEHMGC